MGKNRGAANTLWMAFFAVIGLAFLGIFAWYVFAGQGSTARTLAVAGDTQLTNPSAAAITQAQLAGNVSCPQGKILLTDISPKVTLTFTGGNGGTPTGSYYIWDSYPKVSDTSVDFNAHNERAFQNKNPTYNGSLSSGAFSQNLKAGKTYYVHVSMSSFPDYWQAVTPPVCYSNEADAINTGVSDNYPILPFDTTAWFTTWTANQTTYPAANSSSLTDLKTGYCQPKSYMIQDGYSAIVDELRTTNIPDYTAGLYRLVISLGDNSYTVYNKNGGVDLTTYQGATYTKVFDQSGLNMAFGSKETATMNCEYDAFAITGDGYQNSTAIGSLDTLFNTTVYSVENTALVSNVGATIS